MQVAYKTIEGESWQRVETYVFLKATYLVACPENRRCQVGMGVMIGGKPLGEKLHFSGERKITVLGAGALYVRVDDGQGPCKIGFVLLDPTLIKVSWDF